MKNLYITQIEMKLFEVTQNWRKEKIILISSNFE